MSTVTVDEFIKSFYMKDGYYHTTALELLGEDDINEENFSKAVLSMLDDDEVMFTYDDSNSDNSEAMLFYKNNNRLIYEYIFKENEKFDFNLSYITWTYPDFIDLTFKELNIFVSKLKEYIFDNNIPLEIKMNKTQKRVLENPRSDDEYPELNDKQVKRIKILANFGISIFIALILFLSVLVGYLMNNLNYTLIGFSSGLIIMGIYYAIGIKLKWRHVYCMLQKSNRHKMTPNDINWHSISKIDLIGFPITFLILGLIIGVAAFLI